MCRFMLCCVVCSLLLQFAMEDIEGHTIAEWSGEYRLV